MKKFIPVYLLISLTAIAIISLSSCVKKCEDCPSGYYRVVDEPKEGNCYCCPDGTKYDESSGDCYYGGMITGNVVVPKIGNDNNIIYPGIQGAKVEIENTSYSTTTVSQGTYSISDIIEGAYNVKASDPSYGSKYSASQAKPVVVLPQGLSTVDNLVMMPNYASDEQIIHGKVYYNDLVTPLANTEVKLYIAAYNTTTHEYQPGTYQASTITSSDGSYAFYHAANEYLLTYNGNELYRTDYPSQTVLALESIDGIAEFSFYVP